jgi:hypothetical protein
MCAFQHCGRLADGATVLSIVEGIWITSATLTIKSVNDSSTAGASTGC